MLVAERGARVDEVPDTHARQGGHQEHERDRTDAGDPPGPESSLQKTVGTEISQRLTEIAGLDPEEFNFSQPPPIGGPEAALSPMPVEADPVLGSLEAFEEKLDARERQMRVLEDILVAGRMQRELKPSGWPVANGYMSSVYGWRADPFHGRRALHQGIDFAAPHVPRSAIE